MNDAHSGEDGKSADPRAPGVKLPAPRLQFRWIADDTGECIWVSVYELVIPLREHDIRREGKSSNGEMAVELGRTRRGGGNPADMPNDPPYRDGAHASWDGEALGGLPIFVIDPNGVSWCRRAKPDGFGYDMIRVSVHDRGFANANLYGDTIS